MINLTINRNQIEYVGVFERPVFALVNNVRVLEGLYEVFSRFQVALSDFRLENSSTIPTENSINIFLKSLGHYKLRFDRVEWVVSNFDDDDFNRLPEVLMSGEEWLRSVETNLSFKTHTFVYGAHCHLSKGTAKDFLLSLPVKVDFSLKENLGSGLVFNWHDARISGKFNLIIDHSLSVKDGIFIQLAYFGENEGIDYPQILSIGQQSLNEVLAQIGLQFEQEEEVGS
jgi:hypothetical protein